jgi:hypothetical protein
VIVVPSSGVFTYERAVPLLIINRTVGVSCELVFPMNAKSIRPSLFASPTANVPSLSAGKDPE